VSRATALTEDLRPAVLARAVGKASLLLFCLGLAAVVGSFAAGRWDPQYDSTLPVALRLGPCLLVMAVGITSWLIRRRIKALHRLAGLVLVVGGVALVAATVLALRPFPSPVTTGSASNTTCVPLLDAWQTTVPQPSAADTAAFASVYDGATGVNLSDPVARAQYLSRERRSGQLRRSGARTATTHGGSVPAHARARPNGTLAWLWACSCWVASR
jgi:hypothetical protein